MAIVQSPRKRLLGNATRFCGTDAMPKGAVGVCAMIHSIVATVT